MNKIGTTRNFITTVLSLVLEFPCLYKRVNDWTNSTEHYPLVLSRFVIKERRKASTLRVASNDMQRVWRAKCDASNCIV